MSPESLRLNLHCTSDPVGPRMRLANSAAAVVFSNLGAAYGTAKSGVGICSIGVLRSDLIFRSLLPCVMAGILGIYGLIIGVILQTKIKSSTQPAAGQAFSSYDFTIFDGYAILAAGLCCGLSCLASGLAIGIVGDAGVRANAQKEIFVGVVLILIFAEALGLYGLIIAIILASGLGS